jgi:hypothetical protein
MIKAIKKVKDPITHFFSYKTIKFSELSWINLGEPEKMTGPSGVIPIAVLK